MELKDLFKEGGYSGYIDSPTNLEFVIIPNAEVQRLEKYMQFTHWGPYDDRHMICRFVTSWATTDEDLKVLKDCL